MFSFLEIENSIDIFGYNQTSQVDLGNFQFYNNLVKSYLTVTAVNPDEQVMSVNQH